MKNLRYLFLTLFIIGNISCEEWLDLGSEDRIMENNLFESQNGFMVALNGIYIDLLSNDLYGKTLSYKTFDVLAQYYDCSKLEHTDHALFTFSTQAKNQITPGIWNKSYFLLQNINTIIEHCESDKKVLSDNYYHIIKGEAYALRALIHFELFRIFGPIYSEDPEAKSIVYSDDTELVVRPILKANEIIERINSDLNEAERLLTNYDPIIKEGVKFVPAAEGLNNDMRFRSIRMNYYAVKALIARVALYSGDKERALTYAEQVIREGVEQNKWFRFATRKEMEGDPTTKLAPDRVYMTEILFGVYHMDRKNKVYSVTFSNSLKNISVLRPTDQGVNMLYENNINDLRYRQWERLSDPEDQVLMHFVKYMDGNDQLENTPALGFRHMIPVMRISEMFLTIAECHPDPNEGLKALNKIRSARGIPDVTEVSYLKEAILNEFRREMIGEGQLFWLYKRQNLNEVPTGAIPEDSEIGVEISTVKMDKAYYLFSLPQNETNYR